MNTSNRIPVLMSLCGALVLAALLMFPFTAGAAESGPEEVTLSTVTLRDGQTLRGTILEETGDHIVLELSTGGEMRLPARSVTRIDRDQKMMVSRTGEVWFRDPNRTRYMYAPSAMMLKRGEGYFSQKELLFSAAAFGVTDNVTVLAGTVLPAWFLTGGGTSGMNFIGAVKVGFSPVEKLHLAAGAESLVLPMFGSGTMFGAGFVFGAATYGDNNAHVTVSAGKPFTFISNSSAGSQLGDLIVVVSANYRMHRHLALVTENWLMPINTFSSSGASPELYMLNGLSLRILGERFSADIGLVRVHTMQVPMPWLDVTYNF